MKVVLFAITIFLSSFLLFLVQPIMAKQVLPWFGGSAAVWTTCLVFFQLLLLCGYAYADVTTRKMSARSQLMLHTALLLLSLSFLSIVPNATWKPVGDEDPTYRILGLLICTIGLPYFLLSTTGPMVQAWFVRTHSTENVYRLFALSNVGSLLALISYPVAVEPWVTTRSQSALWWQGYVFFVVACIATGIYSICKGTDAARTSSALEADEGSVPSVAKYVLWTLLSAMGSFMLLAVSNHITHDVASVPFLWLLPLTIYLITFILCFEGRGWYRRRYFIKPLILVICFLAWFLQANNGIMEFKVAVPLFSAGLFIVCMFFHGELAASRPAPRYLTTFFLLVSMGGALGGVLVALAAPKLLNAYYEFGAGLVVTLLIAAWRTKERTPVVALQLLLAAVFSGYQVYLYTQVLSNSTILMTRNFYGTLSVLDTDPFTSETAMRRLNHGVIRHGEQFLREEKRRRPTAYFTETSGVGRTIKYFQQLGAVKVGIIGLGAGTLAAYGRHGDVFRFFEINPQVIEIANRDFSFLSDSEAEISTELGDARLALEREAPLQVDILVVDAFSSDAIPVHLITREAMEIYLKHIKPNGVVAFHVTNRSLKLPPVVKQIADTVGLHSVLIADRGSVGAAAPTDWMLTTRNQAFLHDATIVQAASEVTDIPGLQLWRDDFNNLVQILK